MEQRTITRDDWKLHKMPKACATIPVNRHFSAKEMDSIKLGFRPDSMDDHWFVFYEKDHLYIHRSWTGYCIFVMQFCKEARGYLASKLHANRNPKQCGSRDDSYDVQMAFWVIDYFLLGRMELDVPHPPDLS
jgi:hypothetical protein